jgi:hypothetical protein
MEDADRFQLSALHRLEIRHEFVHGRGEFAVVRGGAEEPFEPALGQLGRGRFRIEIRDLKAFRHLARSRRDAAVIGAEQRVHTLLGDQTLGFGLTDVRLAAVVDDDDADLGAAQVGQAYPRSHGHVEIDILVDDLDRGFHRGHGVDADLGDRPGQGIQHTDDDFVFRGTRVAERCQGERQYGGEF